MDQMSEHSETHELRELLMEILKVQKLILHRVAQLEERLAKEKCP
jgi:hypothetical protein